MRNPFFSLYPVPRMEKFFKFFRNLQGNRVKNEIFSVFSIRDNNAVEKNTSRDTRDDDVKFIAKTF